MRGTVLCYYNVVDTADTVSRQGVAEGDALEFELELVDFDKAPNWEAMAADAKIARAEALKEQGNRMFKAGPALFKHATQKWTKAIQLVDHAFDIDTAEQVRFIAHRSGVILMMTNRYASLYYLG